MKEKFMSRSITIFISACLLIFALGCGSGGKMKAKSAPVTTATGLQYEDIKVGTGATPQEGQTCAVLYVGHFTDGAGFDSSKVREQPFKFVLGAHRVIKGWEEGVGSMKIGGIRKLTIPPSLGWGERGFGGVIPPNTTTVFEVELLGVE